MGLPVAPEDVEQTHAMLDTDSSGALELHEWVDWWVARARGNPSPQKQLAVVARNAFASADEDGSGYLDLEELGALCEDLGAALESDEEIKSAMAMLDRDGNGTLDKDEFVRWWVGRTLEGSRGKLAEKLTRLAEVGRRRAHTSIHQAAWEGDSELVLDFLKVDARLVNAPDTAEYGEGFRPLQYAAYCGHLQICQLLLEGGAQINATNECGCTALFYAAQQGHLDVVKWLMQLKADVTPCERKTGFSALDVASLHEGMREEILEQAACISPPQPAQPKIVQRGAGSVKVFLEPPPLPRDCLRILQYKVKLLDFGAPHM
jgi:Ca2+-binding EF-hand superfamily protein